MQKAVAVGCTINFAGFQWRVLDRKDNRALLISKKIIETRPYHTEAEEISWQDSSLRDYLNGDFFNRFSEKAQQAVAETINRNTKNPWYNTSGGYMSCDRVFILSLDEVARYFGNSGALAQKQGKHINYFCVKNNEFAQIAKPDISQWCSFADQYNAARIAHDKSGKALRWWLRTPGDSELHAAYVFDNGSVDVGGVGVSTKRHDAHFYGVRPALWLYL